MFCKGPDENFVRAASATAAICCFAEGAGCGAAMCTGQATYVRGDLGRAVEQGKLQGQAAEQGKRGSN